MNLIEQLQAHRDRLKDLESKLSAPDVLSDPRKIKQVNQDYAAEREIVEIGGRYDSAVKNLQNAKSALEETAEDEMKELAQMEIDELEAALPGLEHAFTVALIPPDPMDNKNIIVEIRAGAGGDESSLFAGELMRSYSMYADTQGWKTELISASRTDVGGFKEVVFSIKGLGAYSALKYESGVHRVQRVPETEKQGRVHTSTVTVAIMPEAEEVDVKIEQKDLIIEATTSTGAGGQSVNTTYSAVRVTHVPSGIMVYCQEERSQKQNKERALQIIRARVYAMEQEKARLEREEARRGQIGTGGRSEKIRTYNFPQDRVTDHRINKNFHNLPGVMNGGFEEIVGALKAAEIEERLQELS